MTIKKAGFLLAVGYVGGILLLSINTILDAIGRALAGLLIWCYFG